MSIYANENGTLKSLDATSTTAINTSSSDCPIKTLNSEYCLRIVGTSGASASLGLNKGIVIYVDWGSGKISTSGKWKAGNSDNFIEDMSYRNGNDSHSDQNQFYGSIGVRPYYIRKANIPSGGYTIANLKINTYGNFVNNGANAALQHYFIFYTK